MTRRLVALVLAAGAAACTPSKKAPPLYEWSTATGPSRRDPAISPDIFVRSPILRSRGGQPPAPLDAVAGLDRRLLFSRLADGRLAGHYAVDGHIHTRFSGDGSLRLHEVVKMAGLAGLDA